MTWVKLDLRQGRVRAIVVALIIVVVLLLVGWALFAQYQNNAKNNPRSVADRVIALMTDKNADASYDMLAKSYQDSSSKEDWKQWVDVAFGNISGEASFVREFPITNPEEAYGKDAAPVRYVYAFTIDGKAYNVPFVFVKEDGAWKLAEIGSPIE